MIYIGAGYSCGICSIVHAHLTLHRGCLPNAQDSAVEEWVKHCESKYQALVARATEEGEETDSLRSEISSEDETDEVDERAHEASPAAKGTPLSGKGKGKGRADADVEVAQHRHTPTRRREAGVSSRGTTGAVEECVSVPVGAQKSPAAVVAAAKARAPTTEAAVDAVSKPGPIPSRWSLEQEKENIAWSVAPPIVLQVDTASGARTRAVGAGPGPPSAKKAPLVWFPPPHSPYASPAAPAKDEAGAAERYDVGRQCGYLRAAKTARLLGETLEGGDVREKIADGGVGRGRGAFTQLEASRLNTASEDFAVKRLPEPSISTGMARQNSNNPTRLPEGGCSESTYSPATADREMKCASRARTFRFSGSLPDTCDAEGFDSPLRSPVSKTSGLISTPTLNFARVEQVEHMEFARLDLPPTDSSARICASTRREYSEGVSVGGRHRGAVGGARDQGSLGVVPERRPQTPPMPTCDKQGQAESERNVNMTKVSGELGGGGGDGSGQSDGDGVDSADNIAGDDVGDDNGADDTDLGEGLAANILSERQEACIGGGGDRNAGDAVMCASDAESDGASLALSPPLCAGTERAHEAPRTPLSSRATFGLLSRFGAAGDTTDGSNADTMGAAVRDIAEPRLDIEDDMCGTPKLACDSPVCSSSRRPNSSASGALKNPSCPKNPRAPGSGSVRGIGDTPRRFSPCPAPCVDDRRRTAQGQTAVENVYDLLQVAPTTGGTRNEWRGCSNAEDNSKAELFSAKGVKETAILARNVEYSRVNGDAEETTSFRAETPMNRRPLDDGKNASPPIEIPVVRDEPQLLASGARQEGDDNSATKDAFTGRNNTPATVRTEGDTGVKESQAVLSTSRSNENFVDNPAAEIATEHNASGLAKLPESPDAANNRQCISETLPESVSTQEPVREYGDGSERDQGSHGRKLEDICETLASSLTSTQDVPETVDLVLSNSNDNGGVPDTFERSVGVQDVPKTVGGLPSDGEEFNDDARTHAPETLPESNVVPDVPETVDMVASLHVAASTAEETESHVPETFIAGGIAGGKAIEETEPLSFRERVHNKSPLVAIQHGAINAEGNFELDRRPSKARDGVDSHTSNHGNGHEHRPDDKDAPPSASASEDYALGRTRMARNPEAVCMATQDEVPIHKQDKVTETPAVEKKHRNGEGERTPCFSQVPETAAQSLDIPETVEAWQTIFCHKDDEGRETPGRARETDVSSVSVTQHLRAGMAAHGAEAEIGETGGAGENGNEGATASNTSPGTSRFSCKRPAESATLSPEKLSSLGDLGTNGKRFKLSPPQAAPSSARHDDPRCAIDHALSCAADADGASAVPDDDAAVGTPIILRGGSGSIASDNDDGPEGYRDAVAPSVGSHTEDIETHENDQCGEDWGMEWGGGGDYGDYADVADHMEHDYGRDGGEVRGDDGDVARASSTTRRRGGGAGGGGWLSARKPVANPYDTGSGLTLRADDEPLEDRSTQSVNPVKEAGKGREGSRGGAGVDRPVTSKRPLRRPTREGMSFRAPDRGGLPRGPSALGDAAVESRCRERQGRANSNKILGAGGGSSVQEVFFGTSSFDDTVATNDLPNTEV